MYSYNVETPDIAKQTVIKYAGRVQNGDFKWTFSDADNTNYDVNQALKNALVSYVGFVPNANNNPDNDEDNNNPGDEDDDDNNNQNTPNLPTSNSLLFSSLTAGTLSSTQTVNATFTILATSDKTMKIENATATVDGVTYTSMLKLEGKGNTTYRSIKLTLEGAATIKVVAKNNSSSDRALGLLDSEGETLQQCNSPKENAGIVTYSVGEAGTYYITSLNSGINLFAIIIEYN